jgi:hypothetical protein
LGGDGNVCILMVVVVSWVHTFNNPSNCAQNGERDFIVCKLCLNKGDLLAVSQLYLSKMYNKQKQGVGFVLALL